ncbi:MAG: SLC13 family permease [Myxococcota bacterium]
MSWELLVVFGLTVLAVILFISEKLRVDMVALLVMAVLMVTQILEPEQALKGFSNAATITIAAMFVLSEGLRQTGVVNVIGRWLSELFEKSYRAAMLAMMAGVGTLSGFVNNTGVVAIFLPIMTGASRDAGISATKVLMPLSFAAMFGGVCTLIGTSTNLLVSQILADHGHASIGMFEMLPLGIIYFITGMIFMMTVGEKLMPARDIDQDLTESFQMGAFLTEVEVEPNATFDGQACGTIDLCEKGEVDILEIIRDSESLGEPDEDIVVHAGDILRLRGSVQAISEMEQTGDVVIRPEKIVGEEQLGTESSELFEAVIAPDSMIDGKSLSRVDFPEQFGATVLAIRREGELMHTDLLEERLRAGDVLLVRAPRDRLEALQRHNAFVIVSEVGVPEYKEHMILPVIGIILLVVALAAFNVLPIVVSAVAGGVAMVLIRAVTLKEAYDAINWQVVFLLAGILSLGVALEQTGGVDIIADFLLNRLSEYGPRALLAGFYFVSAILTGVMSNQATAILLAPVAISAGIEMNIDPRPLVLSITFAASASFITPVGYQTNTLIYGAGNYRFADFFKVGTPLTLMFGLIAVVLLPMIWPF